MVKFRSIQWKNLLSTGNAFTRIQFDKSPNTLIAGTNGSGKSTLLDAICFALFGTPFRNINKPTLVNSINKEDMVVELEFDIGAHKYKVVRGIKPNIFEIYRDSVLIKQDAAAKDYQAYLENYILHFNKKTFTQVVILGNASHTPFMQLSAADRRAVIDDILDILIFSSMNKLLKERQDTLKTTLQENKHRTAIGTTELELKKKHFEALKQNRENEIRELEEKINQTNQQISLSQARVNENNTKIEELRKQVSIKADLLQKYQKSKSYHERIGEKLDKNEKDIVFWQNTSICPTCEEPIHPDKAHTKVEESQKLKDEHRAAMKKLADMASKTSLDLQNIERLEQQITQLNNENTKKLSEVKVFIGVLMDYEKKKLSLSKAETTMVADEQEINNIQGELVLLESLRESYLEDQRYFDVTGQLLKDSGIKTKIIRQYLPIINKLVNKYLAEMDFFVNFELDENFKETIKSRYRDEFSYENFSEGEKQRIDMALLLTWREVAKLKNSASTNLLILDEIFDSSLDSTGVEYLMKILHGLEKCHLYVISHKTDLLLDKFNSTIRFEKQGNYSRIAT